MKSRVLDIGTSTDAGDRKKINEDTILVKTNFINGQEIGIFVVADGMGDNNSGNRASAMAVEMISFWWDKYFLKMMKNSFYLSEILNHLDKSINLINHQLNSNISNYGTTLSILIIIGDIYMIRHVGNSRIYLINKNITRITRDDSYGEKLLQQGKVQTDDPKYYLKKEILTKTLGLEPNVDIYTREDKILNNDVFLICSDGFYNTVVESDILKTIYNNRIYSMQDKAKELRNLIKKGNAYDDVSIILIKPLINNPNVF